MQERKAKALEAAQTWAKSAGQVTSGERAAGKLSETEGFHSPYNDLAWAIYHAVPLGQLKPNLTYSQRDVNKDFLVKHPIVLSGGELRESYESNPPPTTTTTMI